VRTAVLLAWAAGALEARAVTEPPPEPAKLGLFEWMGPAPFVIVGDVLADDGKFVQTTVTTAVKGSLPTGTSVLVDLRAANRDRDDGIPALKLDRGHTFLLLLKPSSRKGPPTTPIYDLVRGTHGARPVPAEGRAAVVEAAARLGDLQERRSDDLIWKTLPSFLEDPNPHLVDAALELYVKFRRETAALTPLLSPLLESPRPSVREQAAILLGRVLVRAAPGEVVDRSIVIGDLTGRARRDDDVAVRRAATRALAPLVDAGIAETLRTIASDDPDQDVRFEAEKAAYERTLRPGGDRKAD